MAKTKQTVRNNSIMRKHGVLTDEIACQIPESFECIEDELKWLRSVFDDVSNKLTIRTGGLLRRKEREKVLEAEILELKQERAALRCKAEANLTSFKKQYDELETQYNELVMEHKDRGEVMENLKVDNLVLEERNCELRGEVDDRDGKILNLRVEMSATSEMSEMRRLSADRIKRKAKEALQDLLEFVVESAEAEKPTEKIPEGVHLQLCKKAKVVHDIISSASAPLEESDDPRAQWVLREWAIEEEREDEEMQEALEASETTARDEEATRRAVSPGAPPPEVHTVLDMSDPFAPENDPFAEPPTDVAEN